MSFLFGSAPKAQFTTQPTIDPTQQLLLGQLINLLTTGSTPAGVQAYQGQFGAPLSNLQSTALNTLQGTAGQTPGTPTSGQTTAVNAALGALPGDLSYTAPHIDATQAFQQGVVQPLTTTFNQSILPGIAGQYGASAGGAYGSGALEARQQAGTNFEQTVGQIGSQYSLGAQTANQQADLAAQQARLSALGLAPQTSTLPSTVASAGINPLLQLLGAGAVPQETQQTQLTGQYQDFLNQLQQKQQLLTLLAGAGTTPTQTTLGMGSGGQIGLLQGLLTGFASNQGIGNALAGLIA